MSNENMDLKPMLDDLERRVIAGAKETDRWGAEVGAALRSLSSRVAELEKRIAAGFPQGVSVTTGGTVTPRYCPKCGRHETVKPTGNILTSMPPQTEMKCSACQHKWGVK